MLEIWEDMDGMHSMFLVPFVLIFLLNARRIFKKIPCWTTWLYNIQIGSYTLPGGETEIQKRIFFDGGGGCVSYYLGVLHGMFCLFGTGYFRDVHWEGASSGAITCCYALATVHGVFDMRHWYYNHLRNGYLFAHNSCIGFWFRFCDNIIRDECTIYYKILNKHFGIDGTRDLLEKYYKCYTTTLFLQILPMESYKNIVEFTDSVIATSYIPFCTGYVFSWCHYLKTYIFDGCFGFYLRKIMIHPNSRTLYLTTFGKKKLRTPTELAFSDWGTLRFYDVYITGNMERADRLFWEGFSDAVINCKEIQFQLEKAFDKKVDFAENWQEVVANEAQEEGILHDFFHGTNDEFKSRSHSKFYLLSQNFTSPKNEENSPKHQFFTTTTTEK